VSARIEETRLVELPTAAATGMYRRAFGEFVGRGGELASYAIGWATDAVPRVGRLTIGIGAGNEGGGTFHAAVVPTEEGHAFSLVDEPFEEVPEGGPDLTAAEARAHEDLPFIWWVADYVMLRDRRAWWMLHWLLATRAISTVPVFELEEPILLVVNDDDDDLWQLIGSSDAGSEAKLGHLWHAVDEDPTLVDVLDLDPGHSATRERVGGEWTRHVDGGGE
jgi:hypothetical protein